MIVSRAEDLLVCHELSFLYETIKGKGKILIDFCSRSLIHFSKMDVPMSPQRCLTIVGRKERKGKNTVQRRHFYSREKKKSKTSC